MTAIATTVAKPDLAVIKARIDKMVRAKVDQFGYLWARWQDEREYEDISEYGRVIAKDLPVGIVFRKMTKRPFGFHFSVVEFPSRVFFVSVTGRSVTWGQV